MHAAQHIALQNYCARNYGMSLVSFEARREGARRLVITLTVDTGRTLAHGVAQAFRDAAFSESACVDAAIRRARGGR